tara:strand:- start:198 stop:881 length:684 start_codon:yes stop_codon:yes gene_type:complete
MKKLLLIPLTLLFFSCDDDILQDGLDGSSAIMYSALFPEYFFDVYENDPAIPYSGSWNQYYDIISPGTYQWSFCEDFGDEITCYSGYYTTFFEKGEPGLDGKDRCFELAFYISGSPSFYEWNPHYCIREECYEYFNYSCSQVLVSEQDEKYLAEKLEYQKYLEEKNREEQNIINSSNNTSIFNQNITRINNPKSNLSIKEIDNHPDVQIKEGDNYIFKSIKQTYKKQ